MANCADPDETPHSVVSILDLHYLLRPVCQNTDGKCGNHYMVVTINLGYGDTFGRVLMEIAT